MNDTENLPSLNSLEFIPYLNEKGEIPEVYKKKIGVYAIFNEDKILQMVGYSRDIYLSLKQHLVRKIDQCGWLKIETIERPSRTILENIKQGWIDENGLIPIGNDKEDDEWNKPIDAKPFMSEEEKENYRNIEEVKQAKFLKNVARRVEAQIKENLIEKGVKMDIRFNPKLKEKGLLDLK